MGFPALRSTFSHGRTPSIDGVTRDLSGAPLGNCNVFVFVTATNSLTASSVSDSQGNYSIPVTTTSACYVVAYLAGSPDVGGTTVNTVTAA